MALIAAAVRLPGIDRPLVGVFATKNVVYAMIARNWALGRAAWWAPTVDVWIDGERGLHLVEYPVMVWLPAMLWRFCGGSLDAWGRGVSIACSAAGAALLWSLVHRWHGTAAAWGAALMLALAPVSVIFGQSFMLESSLVLLTLATIDGWDRWLKSQRPRWWALGTIALALLALTKIYMVVLALPLGAALWRRLREAAAQDRTAAPDGPAAPARRRVRSILSTPTGLAATTLLGAVIAMLPAAAWYGWVWREAARPESPVARHTFYSVRQSAAAHRFPSPELKRAVFYRQLLDDLAGVALTPVGFALALAGFLTKEGRRHLPWLATVPLLILLLPLKFREMNYYWLVVLPPMCVLVGVGWGAIVERFQPGRCARAAMLLLALAFSARYAVKSAFVTPPEDRAVVAAGEAVRRLGVAGPVVTLHGSTLDLLYYCGQVGFALAPDDPRLAEQIKTCRAAGARRLVIVAPESDEDTPIGRELARWPLVEKGDGYAIHALKE